MPWQEGIVESGKGLPKSHSAFSKRFTKVIFPNEKNILSWAQMKSKNLQDQRKILGRSKQNFCHKEKIFESESSLEEIFLNHYPQVK